MQDITSTTSSFGKSGMLLLYSLLYLLRWNSCFVSISDLFHDFYAINITHYSNSKIQPYNSTRLLLRLLSDMFVKKNLLQKYDSHLCQLYQGININKLRLFSNEMSCYTNARMENSFRSCQPNLHTGFNVSAFHQDSILCRKKVTWSMSRCH